MFHYDNYILRYEAKYKKINSVINRQMKFFSKITILGVLSALFFATATAAKSGANIYAVSRDVPNKSIYGEPGNRLKLSDFGSSFVVAVFWSRYCFPCIQEMESLADFAEKTKNAGIRVILISPQDEWSGGFAEQRNFLRRLNAQNLEIYVDNKGDLTAALGIFSSPVSVLVNREGKEIGRIRGSVVWNKPEVIDFMLKLAVDGN